jgi:hypothetical protein
MLIQTKIVLNDSPEPVPSPFRYACGNEPVVGDRVEWHSGDSAFGEGVVLAVPSPIMDGNIEMRRDGGNVGSWWPSSLQLVSRAQPITCDGCHRSAAPETLTPGIVRGVAGAVCAECASRAKYPVDRGDDRLDALAYAMGVQLVPEAAGRAYHKFRRICEIEFGPVSSLPPGVSSAPYPEPTLEQRYAAFRETVERVVREEAPRATVVTDRGLMKIINKGRVPCCLVWFRCGDGKEQEWGLLDDEDAAKFERFLRCQILQELKKVGARAMGAKK